MAARDVFGDGDAHRGRSDAAAGRGDTHGIPCCGAAPSGGRVLYPTSEGCSRSGVFAVCLFAVYDAARQVNKTKLL